MNTIIIEVILGFVLVALTAITTFFSTKHNLKEYTNGKFSELKDKVHDLDTQVKILKERNENQQQIINTFQKQVLDHLPDLFSIINNSKKSKK